jgi:hypothetical protein
MMLTITGPDNVAWEYHLDAGAAELLSKFASGDLDRIKFSEKLPGIQLAWPMRFELSRKAGR